MKPIFFIAFAGLALSCLAPASAQVIRRGDSMQEIEQMMAMEMAGFDPDSESPGGAESDTPQPKTPLGKLLVQQRIMRTPETLLKARATLAAKARDERLTPPSASKPTEALPPPPATDRKLVPAIAEHAPDAPDAAAADADSPGAAAALGRPLPVPDKNARPPTKEETKLAEHFGQLVTAGQWVEVAQILRSHAAEDASAVYTFLLTALASDTALVPDEVVAISEMAPAALTDKNIDALGGLLKNAIARGADASHITALIGAGTKHFGGTDPAARTRAARFLMAADLPVEAHPYLEPLDAARVAKNAAVINLHAMYEQGLAARKKDPGEKNAAIRRSWELCLEVFRIDAAGRPEREAALGRVLTFLKEIPTEIGDAWLAEVFQGESDLVWALADRTNGAARSGRTTGRTPDERMIGLRQLRRVGAALAVSAGDQLPVYRTALDMMALTIVEEAEDTKNRRRDERFQFIPADQLGTVLPTPAWILAVDPGLAGRLELMAVTVAAGSGDVAAVLAIIRPLAATDKERAQKLADALVEAWPNYVKPPQQNEYDPYGYNYGSRMFINGRWVNYGNSYGNNAGIPLTRARQKRYTEQLGTALDALKALGLDSPSAAVVAAFSAGHSDAEVYVREDVEKLFGPVGSVSADVNLELADAMRTRLGGLWRKPKTQQDNGTKRNDKQIASEVVRGYTLALEMAASAQSSDPDSWRVATLVADLSFDKAEFLYGQKTDLATYSTLREAAFAGYAHAASLYTAALDTGTAAPSARVYFQWLSSALGASDLGVLTRQDTPSVEQVDRVIAALGELPEAKRSAHVGLFAKDVSGALATLAPELKVRFLTHAAKVIGDHPDGADARKQLAYFNDLKTEVELALSTDSGIGSTGSTVGSLQPFGAHLSVWSSRAVSRESGGFGKYLLNQQWHPQTNEQIDYKDDLEKKLRETLSDRFEIVSITFHKPGVTPIGLEREGWEMHPLAYLLLRSKDASVDKLPPLQIDMDFSDGTGTVILPMTSTAALIDSRTEPARTAPVRLAVEQILDAREQVDGIIKLEVRAKAAGLIPPLDSIVDLGKLDGFTIVRTEDHGLQVSELDVEGDSIRPIAERSWSLELAPAPNVVPASFTFPTAKFDTSAAPVAGTESDGDTAPAEFVPFKLSRYTDADITAAQPVEPIDVKVKGLPIWVPALLAVGVLSGVGVLAFALRRRKPVTGPTETFSVPTDLTPLSAIATLRRIATSPKVALDPAQRASLHASAAGIESTYFAPTTNGTPTPHLNGIDTLRTEVKRWVDLAEGRVRSN